MAAELDEYWCHRYSLQYDVHLNKFMVDWDTKEFLTQCVGVTCWEDLDESSKRACFRDYPRRSLPDWAEISQESW